MVLTPHVAGASDRALERTAMAVAEQVLRAARGRPPRHAIAAPGRGGA